MTEQDFNIIETYIQGRMTLQEKEAFEQRLISEPELQGMLHHLRASMVAVRQSALDDKLSLLKEIEINEMKPQVKLRSISPAYSWIAVAAIIVAGAILLRPVLFPDNSIKNQYLAEHFDEYVLHSTVRGNNEEIKITKEQERAYNLYQIQEFHKAMPLLEDLWEEKRDTLALFYLSVSEIIVNKPDNFHFEILRKNNRYYSKLITIK